MLQSVSQDGSANQKKASRTSSCSGVSSLYPALAAFDDVEKSFAPAACSSLIFSTKYTPHVVEATPWGGVRAVSLSCFLVKADFCASVNTLGFLGLGLGLALAFFFLAGFGLGLMRGFAVDFAFGTAFGVVFLGAGFLAAVVFEVVGAFLAVVVVLPVWALGRDTALCA